MGCTMRNFVWQFIRHPTRTGALAASSQRLAHLLVNTAALHRAQVVVELGPGTGVFTEHLSGILPRHADFFAIEINDKFVRETRRRCPDVPVYHGSAANLKGYLKQRGRASCDCIVSSLPWGVFDEPLQRELMSAVVSCLSSDGEFLTYSYLGGMLLPSARTFRRILHSHFEDIRKTPLVWRNMPPAYFYHCRRHRRHSIRHETADAPFASWSAHPA